MSKQDYEEIARVLKNGLQNHNDIGCVIRELAHVFEQTNARFDTDKFYEACGYTYEREKG